MKKNLLDLSGKINELTVSIKSPEIKLALHYALIVE